jgi:hypothetical protein
MKTRRHVLFLIAHLSVGLFLPLVSVAAPKQPVLTPALGDPDDFVIVNGIVVDIGASGSGRKVGHSCAPEGTPTGDAIVCTGIDIDGLAAGRGDDRVTVEMGALVITAATDPQPQSTAIDGGKDNDTITNDGEVRVGVFSLGNTLTNIPALGASKTVASDRAADDKKMAQATGIAGSEGMDTITNNGVIDVSALVNTASVDLPGPPPGPAPKTRSSLAVSESVGIDGGSENDTILNTGTINVSATSLVEIVDNSGTGGSDAHAAKNEDTTASATAVGIRGGDGNDTITNVGHLRVTATTTGITLAAEGSANVATPRSNHGSTFEATATGVAGGAGNDVISNTGMDTIEVVSNASAPTVGVSLAIKGTHPAVSLSTAKAQSTGIEGGDDGDTISNEGRVAATANADASGLFGSIVPEGGGALFAASASGGVAADASASGIAGAEGTDTITNDGVVQAEANAMTFAGAGAIALDGAAHAGVTSKAKADATGVDGGAGDDTVINRGEVEATANADASSMSIAFSQSGTAEVKSAEDGGTSAEAKATGVAGDSGDSDESSETNLMLTPAGLTVVTRESETASGGADRLTNESTIAANAVAHGGTTGAAVSITGAAHGSSSSKAKAQATTIDAGAGSDVVTNTGELTADANATADAVNVAFSVEGEAEAAHDAGATAEAGATGITGDGEASDSLSETTLAIGTEGFSITNATSETAAGGDDVLSNDGTITAEAHALSGSAAAAVSIQGAAKAETTSTSKSTATGIDAGPGADTVTNGGEIEANATASAGALNIAFSQGGANGDAATKAKSSVAGGATAEASATGVAGDGDASETSTEDNLAITTEGLSVSRHEREQAVGGNDTLSNAQTITASARALSLAGGGAISIEGAAEASTTSTAKADASGMNAGAGDDSVTNQGQLTVEAIADAGALNVAFSQKGEAQATHEGGAVAEAAATGLSGDGDATDSESETTLAIDTNGLHIARRDSKQSIGGADTLVNEAMINASSIARSGAGGAAISIEGAAQADTTSKADSTAVAIDAGAGGDMVTNTDQGGLTADASATAGALNIAFSQKEGAQATHDGGATAEARATGIAGDGAASRRTTETTVDLSTSALNIARRTEEIAVGGADTLTNDGSLNATATALSLAGAGAISIEGAAQAGTTSTGKAEASGIDAGIGADTVTNRGEVHVDATANAGALNIAFSQGGQSSEGGAKSSVSGGATAEASATGIAGDGNASDRTSETTLDLDAMGLRFAHRTGNEALGGADTLTNENIVSATATARSGAAGGAISVEGAANASSTSTAKSTATAIDGGAGGDDIVNSGALTADADSVAVGLSVAVSPKKTATAAEGLWDGGAKAEATAVGIDGDGSGKTSSSETTVDIDFQNPSLEVMHRTLSEDPIGLDSIMNNARIDATATAVAPAVDVAISSEGMAAAVSTASAKARAAAIDAGGAGDQVENHGELNAEAVANADAISVAVSGKKEAIAADTVWDGGTKAEAVATGIDADGADARTRTELSGSIDADGVTVSLRRMEESASGADSISNDAAIHAGAVAVSVAGDVAVSAEGVAGALSTSEASSRAAAIDAGGGGDEITNEGALTATADAVAVAVNVAVSGKSGAIAADALWDGGVNAEATAKGIDADGTASGTASETMLTIDGDGVGISHSASRTSAGGSDTITNASTVDATAVAVAPSVAVAVAAQGAAGAISTAHAAANAAAVDGGVGDDTITNTGELDAQADAVAAAVNVAVSGKTGAVAADGMWDGGTTAEASAKGIDADGSATNTASETTLNISGDGVAMSHGSSVTNARGNDTITNDAAIDASAVAVAPSISVPISIKGTAVAASAATARADASAIDAGDADDTVTNSAKLMASSVANADAVNVAVTTSGLAAAGGTIWGGDTTAEATSKGIDLDGSGVSSANETTLTIDGTGLRFSHSDGTEAASGDDVLNNTGAIESTATAVSAGLSVGVAAAGSASAISSSKAKADARAIDAGDGDDQIDNTAMLEANATSVAAALNVSVAAGTGAAIAADAVWDGGTTAEATAKGIDADGSASSTASATTLGISGDGASIHHQSSVTNARGEDVITNDGRIDVNATAVAPSVSVAVAVSGVGVAAATATAKADATGIDGGDGHDEITNRGELDINATANADAVNVSVAPTGGAIAGNNVWNGGTISKATAKGIDADDTAVSTSVQTTLGFGSDGATFLHETTLNAASGNDTIHNEAKIDADAVAVTAGVAVGVSAAGGAAAISTSTARSRATAIDAGDGNDQITNAASGELRANATSVAAALNVSVAAGTGAAIAADAVWDGGTTAEATAKGIDADGSASSSTSATTITIGSEGASIGHSESTTSASGDDALTNDAKIGATATAVAPSVSVAVAVSGVGVATSTATAKADARAIDTGDGGDDITNRGELDVLAVANADAVNVSVTGAGVAIAGNNVWNGGVTAEASAKGIDADGSASNSSVDTTLAFGSEGASFTHQTALDAASGNDTIHNEAKIDADATAVSAGIAVTVPIAGAGLSASTATARSDTRAIDGGDGDDTIINDASGELDATATSVAAAVNVSVTPAGLAAATDAIWNGGTTAEATVKGIDADGSQTSHSSDTVLSIGAGRARFNHRTELNPGSGNDTIVNDAKVDANATAESASVGVSVAVAGVAAAASTATTRADASGIDAGGGNDDITNRGELDVDAVSNANAVAVSVTPAGVAVTADAVWDGGTTAEASATGLTADGSAVGAQTETIVSRNTISHRSISESASGDDTIVNEAKIDAQAVAVAPALDVPVAVFGVAAALSNSTAKADATAIDGGAGNDEITNTASGELTATAVGNADTANVAVTVGGVGVAGNSVWDGGTTVEAVAKGIDADGKGTRVGNERTIEFGQDGITVTHRTTHESSSGDDVITNDAKITAKATAVPVSVAVGVAAIGGVGAAISTSTATSLASAIDAGGGNDEVVNSGELEATANSTAVTVNGSFALIGAGVSADALWDGGTTADATAIGIDADGRGGTITSERVTTVSVSGVDSDSNTTTVGASGDDHIINTNRIVADANAVSPSIAVGLGGILGAALATSTATSKAAAIDAGGGDDEIDNSGELLATADSTAVAVNVSAGAVALSVNNVWDGGTRAEATAKGIDAGGGEDTVTNTARTESVATATAPAVSVAIGGLVGAAVSTATSEAQASAIDTGDDDDNLTNSGELIATADADAVAVNVAVTATGAAVAADAAWDGGTTADARAKGVDGGKGSDEIANDARIEATADADTTSVGVSAVILGGVGASISTSTAKSHAVAVDGGDENDTIANAGNLTAIADSTATGVNVSVSLLGAAISADAVWDGGTTADATAKGINGGTGGDTIGNAAVVDASATANSTSVGVSATIGPVAGASSTSTAKTEATAIDAGTGNDTVGNTGPLTAVADSDAGAVSVSVTGVGVGAAFDAAWDGGTTADAIAKGIYGGGGENVLTNQGTISAESLADTDSTGVSVTIGGVAGAISTSTAKTDSTAIDGGEDGDTITNLGQLTAMADSSANAVSVGVTLIGAAAASDAVWDGGTTADATAKGMDGGGGNDLITNLQTATAISTAETRSTSVSVTVAGAAGAFSNSSAQAHSLAIDGGAGDDTINNSATLTANADADASGVSVSVGLLGAAAASGSSTASANAIGIDGGAGNDVVGNTGDLDVDATADAASASVSVTLAGATVANPFYDARTKAEAVAAGFVGGDGFDTITNFSIVDVDAVAKTASTNVSVGLIGFAGANTDLSALASARASGMEGGSGGDTLDNQNTLLANATAESPIRSVNVNLAGVASADFSSQATSSAIGMGGGSGDDTISSSGTIALNATSKAPASGTNVGILGVAQQDVTASATAFSTGIDGGEGSDQVVHSGQLQALAHSEAVVSGSSWNVAGVSSQQGLATATSRSTGIAGGGEMDTVLNTGTVDVDATMTLRTEGVSTAVFGGASADGSVSGDITAVGIDGGTDADELTNAGMVDVTASSSAQANGSSWNLAGSAVTKAGISSQVDAIGIDGSDGNDVIDNAGILIAEAISNASSSGASWSLAGAAGGNASLTSGANATGIAGGSGADDIGNDGIATIEGEATLTVTGGSNAIFGAAGSGSSVKAEVSTIGIDSGAGEDLIENTNSLSVTSTARMTSTTASFSFAGSPSASALLAATSQATGIVGGTDADWIHNAGTLTVLAQSRQSATGGSSATVAGGSAASARSSANATATGVDGGSGTDIVINDGDITVSANPRPSTAASTVSNTAGAGFIFGSAGTVSQIGLTSTAHGVSLGEGDNILANNDSVSTVAGGDASASAVADGARLVNGDAAASASATTSGTAFGARAGSGENMIVNSGSLSVLANPKAHASASANGNGADGDGNASASASATGVAIGIEVGGGDNAIANDGSLSVTAAPTVSTSAVADSDLGGAAVASATSVASATAIGIRALAGTGNNDITNDGTIDVEVMPSASAGAGASRDEIRICIPFVGCGTIPLGTTSATRNATADAVAYGIRTDGQGDQHIVNNGTIAVTAPTSQVAVGIQTASGNDTIVNNGHIETVVGSSEGVAIRAGAGDDMVTLGDESFTRGDVDLGSGNDTLHLVGTPILNSSVLSGSGTNTLMFDGAGSFANPLPGFAIATKRGAGTFTVPNLSTMQRLEMNAGTLQINNNYQMGMGSAFEATVNGDGTHGQLKSTANIGLAGALEVIKGANAFIDGTTYDVVSANQVDGTFASQTVPAATPILSFSVNQLPQAVQVEASVNSFSSVATNSVGLAVGGYMDSILPTATGDLSQVLGTFQGLSESELTTAFSSLSPDSYDSLTTTTFSTTRRYLDMSRARMAGLRTRSVAEEGHGQVFSLTGGMPTAFSNMGVISRSRELSDYRAYASGLSEQVYSGGWVAGFNKSGNQAAAQSGFRGFDQQTTAVVAGFDYLLSPRFLAGATVGSGLTDLNFAGGRGGSEMGSFVTSIYGTYAFDGNAYVDTVLSYGLSSYNTTRTLDIGSSRRTAYSAHEAETLGLLFEGGKGFSLGGWRSEVFGALSYVSLDEKGFQETGASGVDLIVDPRRTESLIGEVGWRSSRRMKFGHATMVPWLSVAFMHDFDIDDRTITARYAGAPDTSFKLPGREISQDGVRVGGALTVVGRKNWNTSFGFSSELRSDFSALSVGFQINARF